jgi:hypothetical protein
MRSTTAVVSDPARVTAIDIKIKVLQGRSTGPGQYTFADGNPRFGLGYSWTATDADGAAVDTDSCQIVAQVTGTETFPAIKTDECTRSAGSPFNGGINSETLTQPGTYRITVTDQLTGTVQTLDFSLE